MVKRQAFEFGPAGDTWYRGDLRIYPARIDQHNCAKCEARITYETYLWQVGKNKVWEERLICELQNDGSMTLSTGDGKVILEKYWTEAYSKEDFE